MQEYNTLGPVPLPSPHPRLTPHHLGSDVFGSDICTWYVQIFLSYSILRIARHIARSETPFFQLQLSQQTT